MATYKLHRWAVVGDPYQAPEIAQKCLAGYRDQDERPVVTSSIAKINGKEITTNSGTVYLLQDMSTDYRKWLEDEGITYDPENPIHFKVKP